MSTAWTDGYRTEVNYTYGYYRELSPSYQKFCLLLNGIDVLDEHDDYAHCELGFGQGISINVHAASNMGAFFGTDFNPEHASHANQLANISKAQHHFYDDSFEELLNRTDLPMFDSISLHGIWSWINHENQSIILKFIRKYLKPNGVVYISYNCTTGWAANIPMQQLLYSHFKYNHKSNNPIGEIQQALNFGEQLLLQNPVFALNNPTALAKIASLKQQNPNYLVHEYFNESWQCFSFQQIATCMEDIKLSFAGTTDLNVHIENINLKSEHQDFLNQIESPLLKEQCRDYFLGTQFRKDLFVRGVSRLTARQAQQRLRQTAFILLTTKEKFPTNITGALGTFDLIAEIYQYIGQVFAGHDYQPLSLSTLEQEIPQLNYAQILNALVILIQLGFALPCQILEPQKKQLAQSHSLNYYILQQASFHQNYAVLSSPIAGVGISTEYFHLLFYRAYFVDHLKTAKAFAAYVQDVLDSLDWHIFDQDGQPVKDKKASIKIMQERAQDFIDSKKIEIAKKLRLFD